MAKAVILFTVAFTAVSLGQTFDEDVSLNQRNVDFNAYYQYTYENLITDTPIKLEFENITTNLPSRDTLVLVHGHKGSYRSTMNYEIARGVLYEAQEDVNVIVVDWSTQAGYSYKDADVAVPIVAHYLADFLRLLSLAQITPARIHVIGFDLGAHIAGRTGRQFLNSEPLARITGLDPTKSSYKLNKDDAVYVEVIHTNGGLLGDGLDEQMGDADFYPNGGRGQPGCLVNSCCHNRAWQLFAASIHRNTFRANCCSSMTQMKFNTCRGPVQEMGNTKLIKLNVDCPSGIFRVNTRSSDPF